MNFGIVLNEGDLRQMPAELRDGLLKWYFNHSRFTVDSPPSGAPPASSVLAAVPLREDSTRVSFPEFVRAGLLAPGAAIRCRALKRQRRGGGGAFIEAGKVLADGTVEYRGRRYEIPSKLAVEVVNANGGKTAALNGYDYIFVQSSDGLKPLGELRDQFLQRSA